MTQLDVRLYAAFAAAPFGGNIGAVVYEDEPLSAEVRQSISTELAAPTTGFVAPDGNDSFQVHFHSSRREMDMCGHVVVAVCSAMFKDGRLSPREYDLHTKAGTIPVEVGRDGTIWMSQPLPRYDLNEVRLEEIAPLLGLETNAILDVSSSSTALGHLFVEVPDVNALAAMCPKDEALRLLCTSNGIDTIGLWCWQGNEAGKAKVRLRDLCHGVGDPEEAASGTTNAALACHLYRSGRIKADFGGQLCVIGEQGFEMGRPSKVETILTEDDRRLTRVRVGGKAQERMHGRYLLA
jgi:trans-2,3-dihydro-3-hydroxyanthranilate isomerase